MRTLTVLALSLAFLGACASGRANQVEEPTVDTQVAPVEETVPVEEGAPAAAPETTGTTGTTGAVEGVETAGAAAAEAEPTEAAN